MTRFSLQVGDRAVLPRRPILIRTECVGDPRPVRVDVTTADGARITLVERTNLAVLPRVEERLRMALAAPSGLFDAGTVVDVTLAANDDPDGDYVQLRVDVSGLPYLRVLELSPDGPRIVVAADLPPVDPPLPPHAAFARNVVRERLGVAVLSDREAVPLRVAVDVSPSMRSWLRDGTVEAVVELLAGLAGVVDPHRSLAAVLCGRSEQPLGPSGLAEVAASVVAEALRQPLQTGVRPPSYPSEALTYFVTDAAPPTERPGPVVLVGATGGPGDGIVGVPVPTGAGPGLRWSEPELRRMVDELLRPVRERRER